jgi:Arc/MetJ-type ribon-helix-helix transcriptional regulator
MSNAYQNSPYQKEEASTTETVDDLMLRDDEAEGDAEDRSGRTASSVRDIASRIPESLSAIGRDISRTIERAISAKDDYVVAVKVSPAAQEKVDQLVAAGIFKNRAEAAGFLVEEGIKTQAALFERVQQKLAEIERLRAELRGMVNDRPA